jgi:SAM-dependent methyltransferase
MAEFVYTGARILEVMAEARNYNAFLLSALTRHLPSAGRVLDFGAGAGHFATAISRLGHDVSCVELDAANRRQLASAGLNASADLGSIADGGIDFAYSLNVLEHIADDSGTLRSLRAKLRPRGGLFIYVPAFAVLFSNFDQNVGHLRRYRRRDLAARVQEAGFRVRQAEYVDCLGFLAALAYRLLRRDGSVTARSVIAYDRAVFPVSRALDPLFRRAFGKNVLLVAERD